MPKIKISTIYRVRDAKGVVDHQPGDVVDVPESILKKYPKLDAKYSGPKPAAPPSLAEELSGQTVADLKGVAERLGVEVDAKAKKDDLVKAIVAAHEVEVPGSESGGPPA